MNIVQANTISPVIRKLLSFATSDKKVQQEYEKYILLSNRTLYSFEVEDEIVGCIGIERISLSECEIKHIAVLADERGKDIGSKMINFIACKYSSIVAETDNEAVDFYRRYGFFITSLGEKYPGVERFLCQYNK
ncbi:MULTISPECIES: GNAT family N-acetyltransferase [unclassified Lysinibacillus]|uniref:GNAT family N-acetyltransferase n=1 Tax=unclassified Lysinibacillus TaxID=2636778 RepID=UPI002556E617|nr:MULTISPECIES: GNAT family N-acetyltransferase [unclassified Lysinibacillus]MDM5247430.1 GNAT family N-acetyltransferase [Lysinibacillus sp. G4S2]